MSLVRYLSVVGLLLTSIAASADDSIFFTQHNFWFEKAKSSTTNYAVSTLVPLNSKVQILDIDGDELELQLVDLNIKVTVILQKKHTTKTMTEIRDRMLKTSPVDLSKFNTETQDAIKSGRPTLGMTRDALILARGYPPSHVTPSLEMDAWKYWENKWNTILVTFKNGKVVDIKN